MRAPHERVSHKQGHQYRPSSRDLRSTELLPLVPLDHKPKHSSLTHQEGHQSYKGNLEEATLTESPQWARKLEWHHSSYKLMLSTHTPKHARWLRSSLTCQEVPFVKITEEESKVSTQNKTDWLQSPSQLQLFNRCHHTNVMLISRYFSTMSFIASNTSCVHTVQSLQLYECFVQK